MHEAMVSERRTRLPQLSAQQIAAPISGGLPGIRLVDVGNIIHAADYHRHRRHRQASADRCHRDILPTATCPRCEGRCGPARCRRSLLPRRTQQLDVGHTRAVRQPDRPEQRDDPAEGDLPPHPGRLLARPVRSAAGPHPCRARRRRGAVGRRSPPGADGFFVYVVGKDDRAEKYLRTRQDRPHRGRARHHRNRPQGRRAVVITGQYRVAPGVLLKTTQKPRVPVATSGQKGLSHGDLDLVHRAA